VLLYYVDVEASACVLSSRYAMLCYAMLKLISSYEDRVSVIIRWSHRCRESPICHVCSIGVGAQSTLGEDIFARKLMYEKLTICPNFSDLPEKLSKCSNFYDICRKISKIY